MAQSLTVNMVTKKNTLAGSSDGGWLWLVDLYRDETTVIRFADSVEDVTFDSQTYTAKPMALQPIKPDASGGVRGFSISLADADRTIVGYLNSDELRGYPAYLTRTHEDLLSSSTNRIVYRGLIKDATTKNFSVTLSCGLPDMRGAYVPRDRFSRDRCRWAFKGIFCQYAAGETACDKSYDTCKNTMSNEEHFGGFPGLPIIRP